MLFKYNFIQILNIFSIIVFLTLVSCKKETNNPIDITVVKTGVALIKFDNRIGKEELLLYGNSYQNEHDEGFMVNALNYYISNVSLTHIDGSVFVLPKDSCQFLMREDDFFQQSFLLKNIPIGSYKSISFTLGADNQDVKNPIFDVQTKAKDLFSITKNQFVDFIFKGRLGIKDTFEYKVILPKPSKKIELNFGENIAVVRASARYTTSIHLFCDISKFFRDVKLKETSNWTNINANVLDLFSVNHTENF